MSFLQKKEKRENKGNRKLNFSEGHLIKNLQKEIYKMRLVVYHGNQGSCQKPNRVIFKGQWCHLGLFSFDEKFEGENE